MNTVTQGRQIGLFVLEGKRFDAEGVPVEALLELVTYRRAVIDMVKVLFLLQNPDRVRGITNLDERANLRLTEIRTGSAELVLQRPPASPAALFSAPDEIDSLIERAVDEITEALRGVNHDGTLPRSFPSKVAAHLSRLGRTLGSDDSIAINNRADRETAVWFTRDTQQRIRRQVSVGYREANQTIAGTVVEVDTEAAGFRLRTSDGASVACAYDPASVANPTQYLSEAEDGPLVSVQGTALVDDEGTVDRFAAVTRIEPVKSIYAQKALARITEYEQYDSGWAGPDTQAPDPGALQAARHALEALPFLAQPVAVAPLLDGGIRFESFVQERDVTIEFDADGTTFLSVLGQSPHGLSESSSRPEESSIEFDIENRADAVRAAIEVLKEGHLG